MPPRKTTHRLRLSSIGVSFSPELDAYQPVIRAIDLDGGDRPVVLILTPDVATNVTLTLTGAIARAAKLTAEHRAGKGKRSGMTKARPTTKRVS